MYPPINNNERFEMRIVQSNPWTTTDVDVDHMSPLDYEEKRFEHPKAIA